MNDRVLICFFMFELVKVLKTNSVVICVEKFQPMISLVCKSKNEAK